MHPFLKTWATGRGPSGLMVREGTTAWTAIDALNNQTAISFFKLDILNYKVATTLSEFDIIIGGSNFGCGSSREHAPFALEKAGVQAIIAESYARIFYRNSVDGGFLVPLESQSKINNEISTGDELEVNLDSYILQNKTSGKDYTLQELGSVLPIVEAGGIFEYARKNNMI